jgi:hypothetical protein
VSLRNLFPAAMATGVTDRPPWRLAPGSSRLHSQSHTDCPLRAAAARRTLSTEHRGARSAVMRLPRVSLAALSVALSMSEGFAPLTVVRRGLGLPRQAIAATSRNSQRVIDAATGESESGPNRLIMPCAAASLSQTVSDMPLPSSLPVSQSRRGSRATAARPERCAHAAGSSLAPDRHHSHRVR